MIRLIGIAALAAIMTVPAQAQTRRDPIGAAPRQAEPVTPGTTSVPGPRHPNRAKKSLDSPSSKQSHIDGVGRHRWPAGAVRVPSIRPPRHLHVNPVSNVSEMSC
jgi:hypothetical protein